MSNCRLLCSSHGHIGLPQVIWLLNLKYYHTFCILFNTSPLGMRSWNHIGTIYHLDIGVWLRKVAQWGLSTLVVGVSIFPYGFLHMFLPYRRLLPHLRMWSNIFMIDFLLKCLTNVFIFYTNVHSKCTDMLSGAMMCSGTKWDSHWPSGALRFRLLCS